MVRQAIATSVFCGLLVPLTALPVLAQNPTDSCSNPTVISGLPAPINFGPVPATPSFPGAGGCFPGGGGQPAQLGNDLWYVWINTNCAGILADVSVPGATVAFYRGINTCPTLDNAECCAPATVNCELQCCDTIMIQIGNLPPNASGTLTLACSDLPVSCLCPCVSAPAGMIDWWPLDETTGGIASDIVGGRNGTHINSPVPLAGEFVDNSLCFDGTSFVDVTSPGGDIGTGNFSIDAWVRRDPLNTNSPPSVIVDKRNSVTGVGYSLSVSFGRLVFLMSGTNFPTTNANCVPADGLWHFVAVTVDRTTGGGKLYCDGNPPETFTPLLSNLSNPNSFLIGKGYAGFGANQPWLGCIDEVEIFNRALTQFEVQSIYLAGSFGKCKCGPCPNKTNEADVVPCPCGNGVVNLDDILAVIGGFSGTDPCP